MYSAGIEPVTFVTAELGSNCSAIEQTDTCVEKCPSIQPFWGEGGGAKLPFLKDGNVFFCRHVPIGY